MVTPNSEALGGAIGLPAHGSYRGFFFIIQGFVTNYYNLQALKVDTIDKLRRELPALEKEVQGSCSYDNICYKPILRRLNR